MNPLSHFPLRVIVGSICVLLILVGSASAQTPIWDAFQNPFFLRGSERLAIVLTGGFLSYLGYSLFRFGVLTGQSRLTAETRTYKLIFSGTGPGLFFMAFGSLILLAALFTGGAKKLEDRCARLPFSKVLTEAARMEKNLEIIKANSVMTINAWRDLSLDYWTEKVARDGPEVILRKARAKGISVDISKDYQDLVVQVMSQYKSNFLPKINDQHAKLVEKVDKDFRAIIEGVHGITYSVRSAADITDVEEHAVETAQPSVMPDQSIVKVTRGLKAEFQGILELK